MTPKQQRIIVQTMVAEQLKKEKKRIIRQCTNAMIAAFCMELHDKHKWGKKRLNRLIADVTSIFEAVSEKFVTIDDFVQWAREYGLDQLVDDSIKTKD